MTAEIIPFRPDPASPVSKGPVVPPRPCAPGDLVLTCINRTIGLWCAWPVAVVDDDGVVVGVHDRAGRMLGVDRVNCDPSVFGLRAEDHQPQPFAAMRWRTWRDVGEALMAFAEIGVRPPS